MPNGDTTGGALRVFLTVGERLGVPVVILLLIWYTFTTDLRAIKRQTEDLRATHIQMVALLQQVCFRLSSIPVEQLACLKPPSSMEEERR